MDHDDDTSPPTRYSAPAQVFHWAIAVLVVAAFVVSSDDSHAPLWQRQLHESIGFTVLLLSAARLVWRLGDQQPDPPPVARWMGWAATAVQVVLYLLLFAAPLAAITGTWLEGHPLELLGGVRIEPWIEPNKPLGHTISELHGVLGEAILWLAGLHAAAALAHHFYFRDKVLLSMLPRRFGRDR